MSILKTILAAIMYALKWASNRNDPAAVKVRKADAEKKDLQNIAGEIQRKDTDAVNRRIADLRRTPPLPLILLAAALLAGGCMHPRVIYVPESDQVVPMERDGRPGWWVPDHVLADLIERATVHAYKEKEVQR